MRAPRIVWATLVLVGIASVGASFKSSYDTGKTNDRLCEYIRESARVSQATRAASIQRDATTDALLDGTTKLAVKASKGKPRSEFDQLALDYQRASANLREERARNPLPDPPSDC